MQKVGILGSAVVGIVIDTTNPIARCSPREAFNSVGNTCMVNPVYAGGRPTMCFCGNDVEAKAAVADILKQFGWEPADMGTAVAARAIEPLCQLWCIPEFRENHWTHAFKLL